MKKLILKTALLTLAALICVSAMLYGFFALFFPGKIGNLFDGLGRGDIAVAYYELQYQKTSEFDDLVDISTRLDARADSHKAKKYLKILVKHENFEEFCSKRDEENKNPLKSKDFFYGKLFIATKVCDGIENAVLVGREAVKYNYNEYNPFRIALNEQDFLTAADLRAIRAELIRLRGRTTTQGRIYVEEDMKIVEELLK